MCTVVLLVQLKRIFLVLNRTEDFFAGHKVYSNMMRLNAQKKLNLSECPNFNIIRTLADVINHFMESKPKKNCF
jgi:hypothetical protein